MYHLLMILYWVELFSVVMKIIMYMEKNKDKRYKPENHSNYFTFYLF